MSTASNAAAVTFAACTASPATITHVAIGRDTSGTGEIIGSVALGSSLALVVGAVPTIAIGALTMTHPNINLLKLLFQNTTWANVGDATGLVHTTTAGSFFISLHTADPSAGNQSTSETAYTGYARVAVARSSAGWTVT